MSTVTIAVWEWEDSNIYAPYSNRVSSAIEDAKVNGLNRMNLGDIDPFLSTFEVDLLNNTQITIYNGKTRRIRRILIDNSHPLSLGIKWEWNMYGDYWSPYGTEDNRELETNRANGRNQFTLSKLPQYTIDLARMVQTNINTQYPRKIRRTNCTPYQSHARTSPAVPRQPTSRNTSGNATTLTSNFRAATLLQQPSHSRAATLQTQSSSQAASSSRATSTSQPQAGSSSQSRPTNANPGSMTLKQIIIQSCQPYTGKDASDQCPVCLSPITGPSDYDKADLLPGVRSHGVSLSECKHHLHNQCLNTLILSSSNKDSFQCPECLRIYGIRTGSQPSSGRMAVKLDSSISLAGYEQYGTIIVTYSFNSGIQDGVSFSAGNFPRHAYFPDTDKGNKVVDLLKIAFQRRLVFTVGTSNTTGQRNCVVWNDIHHKTSYMRNDAHGYPDPGYLDRVIDELRSKGVY